MTRSNHEKQTALITGGAKRIGRAITLYLSSLGYTIALHYHRSGVDARKTAGEIKKNNGTCEIFKCDFTDERQIQLLIPAILKKFPGLDLLVNSASIFEKSLLTTGSIKALNRHLSINLKAPYILTCEFAKKRGKGQIINILDTNIVKNKPGHDAYLLSKKSLYDLTKLASVELAPRIRVNGIAPGLILPPNNEKGTYLDHPARHIPLQKKGKMAHITRAIQFLLDNDYVTGQVIFADGGGHLI